jgi:tRNA-dihydrouridine synthase C
MEGVVDFAMRDILTEIGGIDHCVTEFLRVTDLLLPDHLFYKNCPELKTDSKTRSGVPVYLQLLGGHPNPLAENAAKAVELGACGIDLNFGCPARTVNNHDGGATLLKNPDRLFKIISAVRAAVPSSTPVTAKIRLGFEDPSECLENALAVESGGAEWLTVHARTKLDFYTPPARWEWIPRIREKIKIPIIANGEVWTREDYLKCREVSGSEQVMIGRGAIANPFIFLEIKNQNPMLNWNSLSLFLLKFFELNQQLTSSHFATARTKQVLGQARKGLPEAEACFQKLKVLTNPLEFESHLRSETHV